MPKNEPRHPSRTVNLSVEERYALARMQPLKGNFVELTMSKNLIALLELHQDEAEVWGYKEEGRGRWVPAEGEDRAAELWADITFSEVQNDRIKSQLEAANAGLTLEFVHVRLYEVFVRGTVRAVEDEALRALDDDEDEGENLPAVSEFDPANGQETRPERQFVDGQKQRERMEGSPV